MEPKYLSININRNQIKLRSSSGQAYLIAMPHKSDYDGYTFWFPEKLVDEGRHDEALRLCIPVSFNFTLKRMSKKTFKVLDEVELNAYQLVEQFRQTDDNIVEKQVSDEPRFKVVEPNYRKPEEVEVPQCLKTK